jgi:hypothetical protein
VSDKIYEYPATGQWVPPQWEPTEVIPAQAWSREAHVPDQAAPTGGLPWLKPLVACLALGVVLGLLALWLFTVHDNNSAAPPPRPAAVPVLDPDQVYLAEVAKVFHIDDRAKIIEHGHLLCSMLATQTPDQVIAWEQQTYWGNKPEQSVGVVHAALDAYCPPQL